jgi:hypothetical protein
MKSARKELRRQNSVGIKQEQPAQHTPDAGSTHRLHDAQQRGVAHANFQNVDRVGNESIESNE